MLVADNIGEHMIGNVYLKFATEEQAEACFREKNGTYYNNNQIHAEYSPVTDFREAKCRLYFEGHCDSKLFKSSNHIFVGGGYCNFIHPKHVSKDFKEELSQMMYEEYPEYLVAKQKRVEEGLEDEEESWENKKPVKRQDREEKDRPRKGDRRYEDDRDNRRRRDYERDRNSRRSPDRYRRDRDYRPRDRDRDRYERDDRRDTRRYENELEYKDRHDRYRHEDNRYHDKYRSRRSRSRTPEKYA